MKEFIDPVNEIVYVVPRMSPDGGRQSGVRYYCNSCAPDARKKDVLMDGMHRVEAVSEDGLTLDEKRSYNRKFTIQNSDIRRANKNSRTSGKRIRTH